MILLNRKVLISTFCSIGCSIHLFQVINEFLKFPVRTEITYDYPDKMIVPEIDIIFYNIDLLNLSGLYFKYPSKMTHLCGYLMQVPNLTINSHENFNAKCTKTLKSYHESSYHIGSMLSVGDVEELDFESLIHKNKSAHFIQNDLCSTKKYFNAINTFIRISCRKDSKQIERTSLRNIVADNNFCIQHDIYHRFGARFAHPNSLIEPHGFNYMAVKRKPGENIFMFLRYRETTIKYSAWPYQTNCRQYERSKIFSKCLQEKVSHSYPGMVQVDDIIEVGQFPSHYKFGDLRDRVNETLLQMRDECAEQVKQLQCVEKTYQTQSAIIKEKGSGVGFICLENQVDSNIILETYPQLTFTELLIYISSIFGIWFGISIYGKLMDGFVLPTIITKISEPITSKVGPGIEVSTMTEEPEIKVERIIQ